MVFLSVSASNIVYKITRLKECAFLFLVQAEKNIRATATGAPLLPASAISDLLNAAKTAATDPNGRGFYTETFIFAACIYFASSFSLAGSAVAGAAMMFAGMARGIANGPP